MVITMLKEIDEKLGKFLDAILQRILSVFFYMVSLSKRSWAFHLFVSSVFLIYLVIFASLIVIISGSFAGNGILFCIIVYSLSKIEVINK